MPTWGKILLYKDTKFYRQFYGGGKKCPPPTPTMQTSVKCCDFAELYISLLVLGLLIMTILFFLNCCRWDHFKSENCCLWYYRWKRNSLSRRQRRCLPGSRPDLPIKTWNRKHIQNSATSQAFLPKSKCIVMNFDEQDWLQFFCNWNSQNTWLAQLDINTGLLSRRSHVQTLARPTLKRVFK